MATAITLEWQLNCRMIFTPGTAHVFAQNLIAKTAPAARISLPGAIDVPILILGC
jgi:hypothetical protein